MESNSSNNGRSARGECELMSLHYFPFDGGEWNNMRINNVYHFEIDRIAPQLLAPRSWLLHICVCSFEARPKIVI